MDTIMLLELARFAGAIAAGEGYQVGALNVLATRDRWTLTVAGAGYDLARSHGESDSVRQLDVLLVTELALRIAVEPFEGVDSRPSWVSRAKRLFWAVEQPAVVIGWAVENDV